MKKPNKFMVELLNSKLKEEGCCLRYVEGYKESTITTYDLSVVDRYIDSTFLQSPSITKEFEEKVRTFFVQYDVDNTGYSNTIKTIVAED